MIPRWYFVLCILPVLALQAGIALANDGRECRVANAQASNLYRVTGKNINIRSGPGTDYNIINGGSRPARLQIDFIVQEECREDDWLRIKVVEPQGLSSTYVGWVKGNFLEEMIHLPPEDSIFSENDFIWDERTGPYKNIIIAGVNKIYRDKDECKEITPSTAYISQTRRSENSPIFYVTCGRGRDAFNVFFSKADLVSGRL